MRAQTIFLFTLMIVCSSCSTRMKVTTTSMEGTIKKGETILVLSDTNIQRNDIIAFEHTDKYFGEQIWIFRVVGIHGDKVEIRNGKIFINENEFSEPEKVKFSYLVRTNSTINPLAIENLEFEQINNNEFIFYLTLIEKEKLKNNPVLTEIKNLIKEPRLFQPDLNENDTIKNWNTDNYGPIVIPKTGEEFYFVLGDNRHNAVDSRYIGLVPKSKVIGIVKK